MKRRFLIPAFFVIDAKDEETANQIAADMKYAANQVEMKGERQGEHYLLLDEILPNKEIQWSPEEELPHSYATHGPIDEVQSAEVCPNCGSGLFNDKGDCQKCGL